MGTHIETIILIFKSARVTLAHFKVSQETIKFILMRLDEIPSNSCTLLGIYEYKFNTLTIHNNGRKNCKKRNKDYSLCVRH